MAQEHNMDRLQQYRQAVISLARKGPGDSGQTQEPGCCMDPETDGAVYASFSDEELLELLRDIARRLGHSPSQEQVPGILRRYLKKRFRNWPGALRAAGLSRAAGSGGMSAEETMRKAAENQQLLEQIRAMAEQLGRMPHPSELPEVCRKLRKNYRTWGEVLAAAGVEQAVASHLQKEEHLSVDDQRMLAELRTIAEGLNRAPLRSEVDRSLREALVGRFGSWRNALYQIGLEPVRRITPFVNAPLQRGKEKRRATHRQELYDCHYRLLKLDPQTQQDLDLVRQLAQQLGRAPVRREVPAEVRSRLQKACGSWSNALFQLGLQE